MNLNLWGVARASLSLHSNCSTPTATTAATRRLTCGFVTPTLRQFSAFGASFHRLMSTSSNSYASPSSIDADDVDELPAHLRSPKLSPPQASIDPSVLADREAKTRTFVEMICTSKDTQMTLDMLHAAMKLETLQEKHLEAMMRRLKVLDAEYCSKLQNHRSIMPVCGDAGPVSTLFEHCDDMNKRAHAAPRQTREDGLSDVAAGGTAPPQRRMLIILETILHERYYKCSVVDDGSDEQHEGIKSAPRRISNGVFNRFLSWVLEAQIKRVRLLAAQDRSQDCGASSDELGDEDENQIADFVDAAALSETNGAHHAPRLNAAEVWQFAALLELHGIGISSELVLDALIMAMNDSEGAFRRQHSGMPMLEDVHKNRLEFVDKQRAAIRETALREAIVRNRSRPQPRREAAPFFVGAPPPPAEM